MLLRWMFGCLLAGGLATATGCCSMPCGYGAAGISGIDDCGSCGVGGAAYCGPNRFMDHLASTFGCGSGCGGMYWGEWTSDPPDACDPCDACGNWTGGAPAVWAGDAYCSPCWEPLAGLRNLWGYRYAHGGYESGCSSCGSAPLGTEMGMKMEMDYLPMESGPVEYLPDESQGDSRLKKPPAPAPRPDVPPAAADGRQASTKRAVSRPVIRQAGYASPRRR